MEITKCYNCGKCFIPYEGQEKCPFCKEVFTNVKSGFTNKEQEELIRGFPEGFAEMFGFK